MGVVQFFQDPRDQQWWMIGSAPDVIPTTLVLDGQSRCKPSSIKFVMITAVEPWFGYMLLPLAPAFFNRYLKPGLLAMWFEEAKTIMSIPKPVSPAKSGGGGPVSFRELAKALGELEEQQAAKLSNMATVANSVIDDPALAKYRDEKLSELKVQAAQNDMLNAAMSNVLKNIGQGLSQVAGKN
jgi:hypothetical protein